MPGWAFIFWISSRVVSLQEYVHFHFPPPAMVMGNLLIGESQSDQESLCFKRFQQSLTDKGLAESIDTEITLMYEVKDICDELHLVIRVFQNQRNVLESFANIFWSGSSGTAKKCREQFIQDCGVIALIQRTERLADDAKRVLDSVGTRYSQCV